ncbi:hypothetical protein ACFQL4_07835 [Halosimplex aquaticum]
MTIHPDGEFAFVPDLFGDTLTVLDVENFEIATQTDVPAADGADADGTEDAGALEAVDGDRRTQRRPTAGRTPDRDRERLGHERPRES